VPDRLSVDGWLVAETDLGHRYHPYSTTDKLLVFRSPAGWVLLAIHRQVRHGESDRPVSGRTVVTAAPFGSLGDLAAHLERTYGAGAWLEILDAGRENDPDLYAAWVPEQMQRDLDRASIYNPDLAHHPDSFDPAELGAPGRALPDWRTQALGAMAAHLHEQGWEVFHDQVNVTGASPASGLVPLDTEIVGMLFARRYGYTAAIVVRVDDCGEIYARLAQPGDVLGPVLRPSDGEDDE
jgi:hypothetical protein